MTGTGAGVRAAGTLEEAFDVCEEITRREARNFAWGIRLLPRQQRQGMSAVYALSRRIDDIGDGELPEPPATGGHAAAPSNVADDVAGRGLAAECPPRDNGAPERLRRLAELRGALVSATPAHSDPVFAAVAETARRSPLPLGAFHDLIDGVESDVRGGEVPDFDSLVLYCRQVAGSVGRLSLGIYGNTDPSAHALADDLGVALQQTNVLRDVREDLLHGRIYLPADELADAGVTLRVDADGRLGGPEPALLALIRRSTSRAERWYDAGRSLLPQLDRRAAACTAAMAGIYHRLNQRLDADPAVVLAGRLSLPASAKARAAGRALLRGQL